MTFGRKNFDLKIYSDPKNENHFLRKLKSKIDFENRLNILKGYSCFWIVRGNKIIKSHDWVKRIYNHFFIKDRFTYEIHSPENIESYRHLAFYQETGMNKKAVYTNKNTW